MENTRSGGGGDASILEAFYIDAFGSYFPDIGYNMSADVQGIQVLSEETHKKISEKSKEYYKTHEGSWKGKHLPEEIRNKISMANKGKSRGLGHPGYTKGRPAWNKGLKMGPAWNRGLKMDEEFGKKISEAKKGKTHASISEEARKKIGAAHRGKIVSEETRKKMSESAKNRKRK